jgi:uncharacterized membrane protein
MDDVTLARAIHVLAVIHWIGGVSLVTLVLIPAAMGTAQPERRLALFDAVEERFARQARISVPLAGLSGFYMTARLDAWERFADPAFWWMGAMLLVWCLFMVVLFVAEPLFLHRWFQARARAAPDAAFALLRRAHLLALALSAVTVLGAVLGAHGAL